MEINGFKIKSYGWTELATLYNPEVKPETASKRLRRWVCKNGQLTHELSNQGWHKGTRLLTPMQVQVMVQYLGEP